MDKWNAFHTLWSNTITKSARPINRGDVSKMSIFYIICNHFYIQDLSGIRKSKIIIPVDNPG